MMPNHEPNFHIDSLSFSMPMQPITIDPIAANNAETPSTINISTPSSLSSLQNSSTCFSSGTITSNNSKRRSQVKNACVNCQKACKKCDDGRPCQRCIKLGITDTCVDSPRKERKKGFKRGPYKKKAAQFTTLKIEEEEEALKYLLQNRTDLDCSSQLHSPIAYSTSIEYAMQRLPQKESLTAEDRFNLYYNTIKNDDIAYYDTRSISNTLIEKNLNNNLINCMETQECESNTQYNEFCHAAYHHGNNSGNFMTTTKNQYYAENHISYHHGDYNHPKMNTIKSFEAESYNYFDTKQQEQQLQQQQQQLQQLCTKNTDYLITHPDLTNATNYNSMHVDTWNLYAHYYNPEI